MSHSPHECLYFTVQNKRLGCVPFSCLRVSGFYPQSRRLHALRIKRYLHDGGASYEKGSTDRRESATGSTDGTVPPLPEAPDLEDRAGLRPVVGSFSRMVVGMPVASAAVEAAIVVDAATVQRSVRCRRCRWHACGRVASMPFVAVHQSSALGGS